eukprot:TRINITY_DN4963_c0_g1_i1.p1 TRINITY_DN4963_c0_g1~~TRINITY_DN4963_c0_g1_i1.p1  ORF type:complete len:219 (+),score=51.70 TRINITY_DN4963_c0_g1_i1:64-720(+)
MPLNRDHLGLLTLILSVPIQYYLVEHMSGTSAPLRNKAATTLVKGLSSLEGLQDTILLLITPKFIQDFISRSPWFNNWDSDKECPALEVLRYREPTHIHFGTSTTVRSTRPSEVSFRIGQVVRSKNPSFKGVIIGWDLVPSAPESWLTNAFGESRHNYEPCYRILVDSFEDISYEQQSNLEALHQSRITSSMLGEYFSEFDGSQYIPLPWLKYIYPKD